MRLWRPSLTLGTLATSTCCSCVGGAKPCDSQPASIFWVSVSTVAAAKRLAQRRLVVLQQVDGCKLCCAVLAENVARGVGWLQQHNTLSAAARRRCSDGKIWSNRSGEAVCLLHDS